MLVRYFFCVLIVIIPFYLVTDSQMKTILVQNTPTHTHLQETVIREPLFMSTKYQSWCLLMYLPHFFKRIVKLSGDLSRDLAILFSS